MFKNVSILQIQNNLKNGEMLKISKLVKMFISSDESIFDKTIVRVH